MKSNKAIVKVIHPRQEEPNLAPLVKEMLALLVDDSRREGLEKTPERVDKALKFLTSGYKVDIRKLVNGALYEVKYDEMVIVRDIEFFSMCEHHLLPFFGKMHVVLAHAEELDVPHDHHLVVLHFVQRTVDQLADVHLVAARQEFERLVHALRSFLQAFALRIFHQHRQHFLDQRSQVRLLLPRMNHFHDRFIRFHGPSLRRCSVPSPRCGPGPAWATRPGTRRSNSLSICGRSPPPGSPTWARLARKTLHPHSGCDARTAPAPAASPTRPTAPRRPPGRRH